MMHTMTEHGVGVLPFDGMGLYEQPRPARLVFKMPRVVPDQKSKFESEELFRRLSRESELVFGSASGNFAVDPCDCDFDKEHGKVHLRSHLIMNGVCVRWRGWIDLDRLDGVGCLEYDEEHAAEEDALLREQIERYNQRLREFEEKQRAYRSSAAAAATAQQSHLNHYHHDTHHAASHHHHHHGHHSRHVGSAGATGATATGIEPHLPHRQDPEMEVRLRAY